MSKRTDHEQLLAEVLTPESDSRFAEQVLAATLCGVRRQRRVLRVRRFGGALVGLLAVAFASSFLFRREVGPELVQAPHPIPYQLIVTQPLSAAQRVSSQPLPAEPAATFVASAQLVRTVAGGFAEVGDEELMAMAAPRVVALVRRGPNAAELVFLPTTSPAESGSQPN